MVVSLSDTVDETGVNTEITSKLNPFSVYLNARSNYGSLLVQPTLKSHSPVPLTGGDSGSAPTSADINRAWNTFLNKEQYEVDVLINSGRTSIVVQHHMDLIARTRGDCVAFLDVPATVIKLPARFCTFRLLVLWLLFTLVLRQLVHRGSPSQV